MTATLALLSVLLITVSSVMLGSYLRRRPLRLCRPAVLGSLAVMAIFSSLPMYL